VSACYVGSMCGSKQTPCDAQCERCRSCNHNTCVQVSRAQYCPCQQRRCRFLPRPVANLAVHIANKRECAAGLWWTVTLDKEAKSDVTTEHIFLALGSSSREATGMGSVLLWLTRATTHAAPRNA
jgi:hypothetical protein